MVRSLAEIVLAGTRAAPEPVGPIDPVQQIAELVEALGCRILALAAGTSTAIEIEGQVDHVRVGVPNTIQPPAPFGHAEGTTAGRGQPQSLTPAR